MRKRTAPARTHPDPQTEASLEQIRALQRRTARMEAEIENTQNEVRRLQAKIRELRGYGAAYLDSSDAAQRQVDTWLTRIDDVEDRIGGVHDEIAKRQAVLSPSDLAYL